MSPLTEIEEKLLSVSTSDWELDQLIIWDWYDGPIEGFCKLSTPDVLFHFRMFALLYREHGADDRLFEIIFLTQQEWSSLVAILTKTEKEMRPIWIPKPITDEENEQVACLIDGKEVSQLLVQSSDMNEFAGCWERQ